MNEDGGSPDLDNLISQRSDLNRAVNNYRYLSKYGRRVVEGIKEW